MISQIIAFAVLATAACAQLTVPVAQFTWPPSRGTNVQTVGVAPCQGYTQGGRVEFPLTNGSFGIDLTRDAHDITWRFSTSSNPESQDAFTTEITKIDHAFSGSRCARVPDLAGLGLSAGQNITVQLSYTAGPQRKMSYECLDLTLVSPSDFAALNYDTTCKNIVRTTQTRGNNANPLISSTSANTTANASSAASEGPLSPTEAGLVGAFTTLGFVLLLMLGLTLAGFARFGKAGKIGSKGAQVEYFDDKATHKSVGSA